MQNFQAQLVKIIDDLTENGYAICEGFLPAPVIKALADVAYERFAAGEMQVAKTGKATNVQQVIYRHDSIYWLDEYSQNTFTQAYFAQIALLKTALNQQLFLNLHDFETHLAVYPIGGVYLKHLDQLKPLTDAPTPIRQLSSVLYLNNNWQPHEGGELRLHLNAPEYVDILPNAGRLILFLSAEFWHEVLPATRSRISLTGWFRSR